MQAQTKCRLQEWVVAKTKRKIGLATEHRNISSMLVILNASYCFHRVGHVNPRISSYCAVCTIAFVFPGQ